MSRLVILLFLFFICPVPSVLAARTISITSPTTTLTGDQEMTVTASVSGFTIGEVIYIKGAFSQPGTANYFGYTKGDTGWVKNSAANASQRQVTVGTWDGTLTVKSDPGDSGYKGEGEYAFRLRFYYGSFTGDWSANALSVTINDPDPTVTPTPIPATGIPSTSVPSLNANISPTLMVPGATAKPKPAARHVRLLPTVFDILASTGSADRQNDTRVLGSETEQATVSARGTPPEVLAFLAVGSGIALMSFALAVKQVGVWKHMIETNTDRQESR